MAWVKLDDRFWRNRKVRALSSPAFRLYVCALSYAGDHMTDGHLDEMAIADLTAVCRTGPKIVGELVDAGMWDRTGGGYHIHDFLDMNPSREKVIEERQKARERKERWLAQRNAAQNGVKNAVPNSEGTPERNATPLPSPPEKVKSSRGRGAPESGGSAFQGPELRAM